MKQLKLGLGAAVAALAMIAFIGAGTSSAAVLCTNNMTDPCSADEPGGTEIAFSLSGSTLFENAGGGTVYNTCTAGQISAKTSNTGGNGNPITASINFITLGANCTNFITVVKTGSLSIAWNAGTSNGTVSAKETELKWEIGGVQCTFGPGAGLLALGTLTGGPEATLSIVATLGKTAGGLMCPASVVWTATYKVTNLTPLYIMNK